MEALPRKHISYGVMNTMNVRHITMVRSQTPCHRNKQNIGRLSLRERQKNKEKV